MLLEMFSFAFVQRALAAGVFISLSCAALGSFLVLRRYAMIGDGLAHVAFGSVALGFLLGLSPIMVSIPVVMAVSLWILRLGEKTTLYGETAIGLASSLAVALGVLIAGISGGFNVDLFSYLFGSILAITGTEVALSVALSFVVLLAVGYYYSDLFAITYDEDFARVSGVPTERLNRILILLTALTVTLGIRVVGTLLVSSLIIFPAVTALQLGRGFKGTILIAMLAGVLSVVLGILISFLLDLPTGALIVLVNFILFGGAYLWNHFSHRS